MTLCKLRLLGAVALSSLVHCSAGPDRETGTVLAVTSEIRALDHSGPRHREACHHAGTGGGGGGEGPEVGIAVTPDATGWIAASSNALGIEGPWYAFADGYDNGARGGTCQAAGHADLECSVITTPDVSIAGFPNTAGRMCLAGTAAQVLPINGAPDWGGIWGAGMGFDLDNGGGAVSTKGTFDASAHGIVGIAFDIDNPPALGLRVEFPTPQTAATSLHAYWGASEAFPNSPISVGTNVVHFSEVQTPDAVPQPLDITQIEALQFLVPTYEFTSVPFSFCISNVKFLMAR